MERNFLGLYRALEILIRRSKNVTKAHAYKPAKPKTAKQRIICIFNRSWPKAKQSARDIWNPATNFCSETVHVIVTNPLIAIVNQIGHLLSTRPRTDSASGLQHLTNLKNDTHAHTTHSR
jgi:hypothetical protein